MLDAFVLTNHASQNHVSSDRTRASSGKRNQVWLLMMAVYCPLQNAEVCRMTATFCRFMMTGLFPWSVVTILTKVKPLVSLSCVVKGWNLDCVCPATRCTKPCCMWKRWLLGFGPCLHWLPATHSTIRSWHPGIVKLCLVKWKSAAVPCHVIILTQMLATFCDHKQLLYQQFIKKIRTQAYPLPSKKYL